MTETMLPAPRHLDSLGDPATSVILSCERAKEWLAVALEGNHIETIIEIKSQAEAMRVYTLQRQLGKDAELSAAEVVRRAERCIGLAIRKGQAEGRIAKRGQGGGKPPHAKRDRSDSGISCPTDFASATELSGNASGIYSMTDDVPAEAFEAAITEAKAEGNLSRANVVRKVQGEAKVDRWAPLARLAAEGHSSDQIAAELGFNRQTVASKARSLGIDIPADRIMGKSRRPDSNRAIRAFVETLESLVPSCEQIDPARIDPAVLAECLALMDEAMRAFSRLRTRLRKG